jgi:hypothetical protein
MCSDRGICDRSKGECECDTGKGVFEGDACEKFACAANNSIACGLNGECVTMAKLARRAHDDQGMARKVTYKKPWDAYKIRACTCAERQGVYGVNMSDVAYRGPFAYAYTDFAGYDCSKALCPFGDNPYTFGENEIQTLNCTAKSGSFYLSFRDELSSEIQHDASAADVKAAIEASIAVGRVSVTFSGSAACNLANLMSVEFLTEFGDVPMLCVCQRLFLSRPPCPATVGETDAAASRAQGSDQAIAGRPPLEPDHHRDAQGYQGGLGVFAERKVQPRHRAVHVQGRPRFLERRGRGPRGRHTRRARPARRAR